MTQTRSPKLNAATHWMTSRQPLIPSESEEDLLAHLQHWNNLYPDVETDELLSDLVREAAFSQWLLIRNQRQYDASLAILHATNMDDWTPEQNKTYQLRERYLNAAHRRLNRHRSDILQYQRDLRAQAREDRAAQAQVTKEKAENPQQEEPLRRPPLRNNDVVEQWILVRQTDGKTETVYHPTNQNLLEGFAHLRFETTLIRRLLRFDKHFAPPEYESFTESAAKMKESPNLDYLILPITFRSFRIAIEREKELGGYLRRWPDLRQADEPFIQLQKEKESKEKESNNVS